MPAQTVVLWRHGQTNFNTVGKFQGHIDTELDEFGWGQVRAAAPLLAEYKPQRIVSSDLKRAQQTASALADLVDDVSVETDERLRETAYGRWEGLTRAEVKEQWADELARWSSGDDEPTHGGESRVDSASRAADAIKEHIAGTEGGALVVVGHGGSLRGAVGQLLELPLTAWDRFAVSHNAHWNVFERRRQGLTLVQFNVGTGA
ncbi:histidine phosphatase family protein [Saxibacter everestensis]|uniref:Histidine phosphatase family protein n=1 Tax=Saxibacter everestensis TaxID=2909229 RepID=A0ABY8R0K0_9MICO|nr:histidine phosphatase family protein [Brevibacteriaceae bacterium ZFBP1038]